MQIQIPVVMHTDLGNTIFCYVLTISLVFQSAKHVQYEMFQNAFILNVNYYYLLRQYLVYHISRSMNRKRKFPILVTATIGIILNHQVDPG